jgi:hypothetical protein
MPLMRLPESQPLSGAAEAVAGVAGDVTEGETRDGGAVAASKPAVSADVGAVLLGYGLVVVGAAVGILLWKWRDPASFTPGDGISVFAPLYILAQAIERFIEPFSTYLGEAAPDDTPANKKRKAEALDEVNKAIVRGQAATAAQWQRVVDRIRRNTAVIAWGLASFLGMTLCGLFGLFMLRLVGFTGVPEEADIVISGLAVGSGTKPLHDLISNMQKAKESKEDPPEKTAS